MRIRHGQTVEVAVKAIDEIVQASQVPYARAFDHADIKLNLYLNWVDEAQRQLRSIFADSELEDALLGRGYWHICGAAATTGPGVLGRMINEELVAQVGYASTSPGGRLGDAVSHLRSLRSLATSDGDIYVPDTNALLHYTRFDQLDWRGRTGAYAVRLVLLLVVVNELDAKKYARREEFQSRARDLLVLIDKYLSNASGGRAMLEDKVTVEVLPDERGHIRMPSADQEILEQCDFLRHVTDRPVTLVTGDSGMRVNAAARGMAIHRLTPDDLLPRYKMTPGPEGADGNTA